MMRHQLHFLAAAALLCGLMLSSCADDPDPDISGRVLHADGSPAAGVDVMIAYHLEQLDGPGPAPDFLVPYGAHMPAQLQLEYRQGQYQMDSGRTVPLLAADTPADFDTNRIYRPIPNPSCDGYQTIWFELADSATVTLFARSMHGLTDYDLLFMEPFPPGRHNTKNQMLPGLYEINATFIADTLVSLIIPETAFLEWSRDGRVDCSEGPGFPVEVIGVTDDRGRFSVNRKELLWRPRIFEISGAGETKYRLGIHAALFVRPDTETGNNGTVPVTHIREIDLTQTGHFIELTSPEQ